MAAVLKDVQDGANGRVFSRVNLEVEVTLRNENTFFTGFSENISEGGLFVATEAPWEIGERIEFTLSLMGGEVRTHQGIVRWVRPANASGGLPAGMGVQFAELSDEENASIQNFVDSRAKDTLFFDLD